MFANRTLVIAAHPDDEVLGCGGVMAKLRKRAAAVRVLFVGEGSSCRFEAAERRSPECIATVARRVEDARTALGRLGITEMTFLDNPCGRFDTVPLIDIGKSIEREIANFEPDTILTHALADVHNDHKIVFQATLQATRPGALNRVATILSYEVLSSSEWTFVDGFLPNYFVPIADEIDAKLNAIAAYASEIKPFPFPRSAEAVRALAMLRGSQAGELYAEAFHIVRSIMR